MICLPRSRQHLLIRANAVRGVGNDLAADTSAAPVNNLLHFLFSQVDVYLNDTFETLHRILTRFAPTSIPYWVTAPRRRILNSPANYGTPDTWIPRPWIVAIQAWLNDECSYRRVELSRWWGGYSSTSSFRTEFSSTVHIVDSVLFACNAMLCPTIQMAHIKSLEKGTSKYQKRSMDCKVYSIPQGAMSHTHENLSLGTLTKRLILWCIDNDEYAKQYPTPRSTVLTSWPSTSTDVRYRPNR